MSVLCSDGRIGLALLLCFLHLYLACLSTNICALLGEPTHVRCRVSTQRKGELLRSPSLAPYTRTRNSLSVVILSLSLPRVD